MKRFFPALVTSLCLALPFQESRADSMEEDFTAICGWYRSLAEDEKNRQLSVEEKFSLAFDEKTRPVIKYTALRMYYSALRTTHADQRYDLMRAYAEGTLGKPWECPPMQTIMNEFASLDRMFQYSQQ